MAIATPRKNTLTAEELFSQKIYWLNQLSGELPETNLITDYVRPITYSGKNKSINFKLSNELSAAIIRLSGNSDLSIYLVLLSALSILMHKYTGNNNTIISSPTYKLENIDENPNNIIPLRISVKEQLTFKDFLLQVKETTIGAYSNQNYSVDELVRLLKLSQNQNRYPFCDIVVLLEDIHQQNYLADLSNDLTFAFKVTGNEISVRTDYNESLFQEDSVWYILKYYLNVLEDVVNNPYLKLADISLLKPIDKQQLLDNNHKTKQYPITQTIDELFERKVEQTPNRVAVDDGNIQLTYRELNEKANQLARFLQNLGVSKGEFVGIYKERDINFLIGILAIYKAGGAYVPIDSQYPPDRVKYMVANSEVRILLTDFSCLDTSINLGENCPYLKYLICLDHQVNDRNNPSIIEVDIYSRFNFERLPKENLVRSHAGSDPAYMLYTSGSTGLPKGAIVRHDGAINHIYAQFDELELTADFCFLQSAPSSTDISVWQFLAPLLIGGKTVIVDTESGFIPEKLFNVLREKSITVVELVPAVFGGLIDYIYQLPEDQRHLPDLKWMMVVGEPVSVKRVNQWLSLYPSIRIADAYGPTEAADDITQFIIDKPLPENQRSVPIGQPLANLNLYILDRKMQLVPIGFPGEICVSGIGVGDGYWKNEEKTKLSFVPNSFSETTKKLPRGNRDLIYKTGDLGRWLPDGNIEFLGRIDNQVKIRGFRIELEEIEALLRQHPSVRETVVIVREDTGDKRLVAYVVPQLENQQFESQQLQEDLVSQLRHLLKERLPQHMIPSAIALLENLPLAPSGKVDRRALPAPDFTQQNESTFVAASTPIQEMLVGIWIEVLDLQKVGIHDNFFELGGHSLLATRVISKVRQVFEVELPLRRLFEQPTVAGLATVIEKAIKAGIGLEAPPIERVSRNEELILSFAQQRLWFLTQLQPDSPFNNLSAAIRLQGQLDLHALQESFNEIVRRHEVLRTTFKAVAGKPIQIISSETTLLLPVINLSDLPADLQAAQVKQLAQTEAQQPFNLQTDLTIRAKLLRLGEQEYVALLTLHHIAADGWSIGVFVRELSTLYQAFCTAQPLTLLQLPIQYADFAAWQRQWLTGEVLESQLGYWRQHLDGAPALLELPTDRKRPAIQTFRGANYSFGIPQELSAALNSLSQQQGCTLFMTLLAAFKTLLYRYTGNEDIVIGSPIANRNRVEIEPLIGFFVNTLVLRTKLEGNPSFEELLSRVREVALGAYSHQDLPFDVLVEELQPQRSLSHTPLFQVMFVLQNAPMPEIELSGLNLSLLENDSTTAKFDLTLFMEETTLGLIGTFEYSTDLFEADTIHRMAEHLQVLLSGIVTDSQQHLWELPLLTEAEKTQMATWNDTQVEYPLEHGIHQLFEAQVERTPDAVAVVCADRQLTYTQLNQRANKIAHYLQRLGVGSEVLVGICLEPSLDTIAALLGILKAGGAYLPLDPAYPQQRLAFMLADAQVSFVISHTLREGRSPMSLVNSFKQMTFEQMTVVCLDADWDSIDRESLENPVSNTTADNLAYVIYTSGSTGKPKGVLGLHRGAVNRFQWMWQTYSFTQGEVCCQKTSLNFVDSVWEIFGALLQGVRTVIVGDRIVKDPHQFVETLKSHSVTRLVLVPSLLRVLLDMEGLQQQLPKLKYWVTSGEALGIDLLHQFQQKMGDRILLNLYGASEVSADVTCYSISSQDETATRVAIGRPIANTQIHVLDRHRQKVPVGVPGELYISGAGLARGYLNRPEITAERFIFKAGRRLYKTGDLVRYRADGNLEFLGRIDNQIKLRGFRIELGEIEALLRQHPGIQEAVVVVREDEPSNQQLVAYVVAPQQSIAIAQLHRLLKEKLPEYMVPSAFVMLEALPLLPNGKVNYQVLPAPETIRPELEQQLQRPQTEVEQAIANIWQEVLRIDEVGIYDNFFELGGHSLLLIQVHSKLQQKFQQDISLVEMFQYPTIAHLTKFLTKFLKRDSSQQKSLEQHSRQLESRSASIQRRKEIRQKHRKR
ncbi:amino acid adenylation domain-containing protein [Chroococcidiopsis sp. FACHB-1243]|uniref:non-ribosomal peptide synthetase n=1 Tax=Chroococcidiopsis sp. [FACHB-1243] TaxID=2692781 RepID=UPI0017873801|nr:non-ribosomal peptide synthetase [Chroococcidiopsis sp. [FACHB-1243]]MBD2309013.1 amino acid adenylation domain-containing protein [Chroococcidiopsis sp. [FACHB-1243]]